MKISLITWPRPRHRRFSFHSTTLHWTSQGLLRITLTLPYFSTHRHRSPSPSHLLKTRIQRQRHNTSPHTTHIPIRFTAIYPKSLNLHSLTHSLLSDPSTPKLIIAYEGSRVHTWKFINLPPPISSRFHNTQLVLGKTYHLNSFEEAFSVKGVLSAFSPFLGPTPIFRQYRNKSFTLLTPTACPPHKTNKVRAEAENGALLFLLVLLERAFF